MKTTFYISIVLIILLSLLIWFQTLTISRIQKELSLKNHQIAASEKLQTNYSEFLNGMVNIIELAHLEKFNGDISLVSRGKDTLSFCELSGDVKLVFKFKDSYCNTCINAIIKRISAISSTIGWDHIFVIMEVTNLENEVWIKTTDQYTTIKNFYFVGPNSKFIDVFDRNDMPYVFVINRDGNLSFPLPITDNWTPVFLDTFFSNISAYFNNLN